MIAPARLVLGAALALALMPAAPGCGGSSDGPRRAVVGYAAPPLANVRWVPAYPIGEEPSLFNEGMLLGKVVLLDFYASW